MRDDPSPILTSPLFKTIEPPTEVMKLALRCPNGESDQLIRWPAQTGAKAFVHDPRELLPRGFAQDETQLDEGITGHSETRSRSDAPQKGVSNVKRSS